MSKYNAEIILAGLIDTMNADNNGFWTYTLNDLERTRPHIEKLYEAGYFQDSMKDLDGSWWICAAGERDEAKMFFNKEPKAYAILDAVLNEIFDR